MPFCGVLTDHQLHRTQAPAPGTPAPAPIKEQQTAVEKTGPKSLVNSSGAQELRQASSAGNAPLVRELCKKSVPFDADIEGRTALHYAAANGHTIVVKELIAAGIPINAKDALGYTPLLHAATDGHVEVVKLLLKNKAIVDAQDDVHFNSALHESSWKGYSQTIEVLCKNKANAYLKNKQGHSALHLACQQGHNQSCRILLMTGCKPDVKNNFGDSPLHSAARYGHAGVVRILLSAYCNVNDVNKNGDTALHISAAMGRKKLTRILLESGSNPAIQNKQGETAMSICIRKSYNEVQEIIANPPPLKPPTVPQTKTTDLKTTAKREKDSSQGSKDSSEKRRQERFKKTRSGSSRSVHFMTDTEKQKKTQNDKKLLSGSCEWSPYGCHMHPEMNDFPKPKLDSLPEDPLTKGEQYYIDLAGNIRKGPVGKSNKCYCRPLIQNVEKRMEKDKQELIEHIDFAHENLTEKICSLEKKTHHQLVTLNEAVHQKLAHERHECNERVQRTALKERIDSQRRQRLQIEELKGEVKTWIGSKLDIHRRSCSDRLDHMREPEFNQNQNQNPYQNQIHNNNHNHNHNHNNLYFNYHQNYRQTHPLERTTSHVNVPALIYGSHQMSDQNNCKPKNISNNSETINFIKSQRQQHMRPTPISRSKSDMYLTGSVDNSSEGEDDDEEETEENTVVSNSNSCVKECLHEINVPNVTPGDTTTTAVDNRQPVYGCEGTDTSTLRDFERLGARPKEPLRIRTSSDTINEANLTSDQNSGSSLEMSVRMDNNRQQSDQQLRDRTQEPEHNISADITLSADLMKTLRCNGSAQTNSGEQGDSPFNDSGYRTKFSPSPRDVSVLTTHNGLQPNQTSNPKNIVSNYKQNGHPFQHQNTVPTQHYGAFDPPIGLPTNPQPMQQKPQLNLLRKIQIPNSYNNRSYNGPNSSLV